MGLRLIASPRFQDHLTPPGHPECPDRARVFDTVAGRWRVRGGEVVEPVPAGRDDLVQVHQAAYVDRLIGSAGRALRLDADTFTSAASIEVARLAAGAAIQAVDHACDRPGPVLALVRPPGHHAEWNRAMGFCLFNNAALAAARARARGLARVAIVDFDVHHGNGTQWLFYDDPSVLYVSVHQYPFYPGSGAAGEAGQGDGTGFTLNAPLEAGATDADYDLVFAELIGPVLERFDADLLVVSAGYDAHARDPLGGMRVTTGGFAAMVARLWSHAAARHRRLVAVTEGGYDLSALASSLEATIEVLSSAPSPPAPMAGHHTRAQAALRAVRAVHADYWPGL
jgi:acetoin utilization deacetylase AcuC-like enzyme